jgi:hypothetical protein
MGRTILSTGALVAAATVIAGCGGSMSASGNTTTTTSGVAGAQKTRASAAFRLQVLGFEARLRAAVRKFESGNLAGAAAAGGPILNDCLNTVDAQLAPAARTRAERQALAHVRYACQDITDASQKAASGDLKTAKRLSQQALTEAQHAVAELR